MDEFWLDILKKEVDAKGPAQVARELGVSTTTVSLVMSGKYGASTRHVEQKVEKIYGHSGRVTCQLLGEIEPAKCATNWELAGKIGVSCGNPATMRLYKTCLKCEVRNS